MSVIISVLTFLFVIAVLIAVHEWGHYRMAALVGVRVVRFSLGFGRPLFKWTPKHQPLLAGYPQATEFVIAALPFGGYVKMQDEREPDQPHIPTEELPHSFNRKPLWARAAIVFAGPLANLILAIALFTVLNWVGSELPKARLIEVVADGAAAAAKLEAGDLVLSVNGRLMTDSFALRELIRKSDHGLPQDWLIQRRGQELSITVSPRVVTDTSEYFGAERIGRVGAIIGSPKELIHVRYGLIDGIAQGVGKTWDLSALTIKTLVRMMVGEASLKNLTGPVTVAEYSGKTAAAGLGTFVLFLGLMSVSLGVLNLLPLPMLDGGHLMYYL